MADQFIELKTTEGQMLFVRREAIEAFEVVTASARVEGHIKLYIGGFKFLIQADKDELFRRMKG